MPSRSFPHSAFMSRLQKPPAYISESVASPDRTLSPPPHPLPHPHPCPTPLRPMMLLFILEFRGQLGCFVFWLLASARNLHDYLKLHLALKAHLEHNGCSCKCYGNLGLQFTLNISSCCLQVWNQCTQKKFTKGQWCWNILSANRRIPVCWQGQGYVV